MQAPGIPGVHTSYNIFPPPGPFKETELTTVTLPYLYIPQSAPVRVKGFQYGGSGREILRCPWLGLQPYRITLQRWSRFGHCRITVGRHAYCVGTLL